jgi:hypothetical protein
MVYLTAFENIIAQHSGFRGVFGENTGDLMGTGMVDAVQMLTLHPPADIKDSRFSSPYLANNLGTH